MLKKNFFYILFFLLLIIFIALTFRVSITENMGGSSDRLAFNIPTSTTIKNWTFPDSINNWYTTKQSQAYKFSNLGFNTSNNKFSVSFLLNILDKHTQWRNIFRFSNKSDGSDGDQGRNPGLWVWPNDTRLHFRVQSNATWNDGFDTIPLPTATTKLITFVIDGNTIYFYLDNILSFTGSYNGIQPRKSDTVFYINDGCCDGNDKIKIKNLTFYDGALTQSDINNMYDALQGNMKYNSDN